MVPHADRPFARGFPGVPAVDAVQLGATADALVAISLTTREVGLPGVKVLLAKSLFAEIELRPSGVTKHEQHETNCSSGEKANTFTHRFPFSTAVELWPVLVKFMTESPNGRFAV